MKAVYGKGGLRHARRNPPAAAFPATVRPSSPGGRTRTIPLPGAEGPAAGRAAYEAGYRHFICGMAQGCDLYFCELALALRAAARDVSVEAAIPCPTQADGWPRLGERYRRLVAACDTMNTGAVILQSRLHAAAAQPLHGGPRVHAAGRSRWAARRHSAHDGIRHAPGAANCGYSPGDGDITPAPAA